MSNHPSMYWQLSHLSTPFTPPTLPLHLSIKLTDISNTFHTSMMTVTLPDNCYTSPSHCSPPPLSSQFSIKMTHLSIRFTPQWGLSQFLTTVTPSTHTNISPMIMTITPLHQLTFMFNTFHTFHISLMTVKLPQANEPHDDHTSSPTDKPP